jgi:hemoglobin
MGGQAGVEGVATQMVANVGAETGTANSVMFRSHEPLLTAISSQNGAPATDPTRLDRLRNNVIDQFTDITGGPIKYKGKSMLLSHTNMHVTEQEYAVWRGILDKTLDQQKIGAKEKAEFTALIDAMKADVVNH